MITVKRLTAVCATGASFSALLLLSGCGAGAPARSIASGNDTIELKGYTYGGPNPILGSAIKLYTTGYNTDGGGTVYPTSASADDYGVATLRSATVSSLTDGSFNLPGGYYCPAGQFAYITGTGGNTGGNSTTAGSSATATAALGVTSYAVPNAGSGFTGTPTVTVDAPSAAPFTQAAAAAVLTPTMGTVTLTNAGAGYTASPTVTVTNATTTQNFTTTLGASPLNSVTTNPTSPTGALSFITVGAPGTGYTTAPTVSIAAPPCTIDGSTCIQATATATVANGGLASIAVNAAGAGYTAAPTVTFGGPGSGGTATAAITKAGYYSDVPAITFSGGSGSGAMATANLIPTPISTTATITNAGNFTPAFTSVTVSAPTSCTINTTTCIQATATCTYGSSQHKVTGCTITNQGAGYTARPTLTVNYAGGSTITTAAVITLYLSGSSVSSITLNAPGSGYTSSPTVAFSVPTGTTAANAAVATANLGASSLASLTFNSTGTTTSNAVFNGTPVVTIAPPPCTINGTTCVQATASIALTPTTLASITATTPGGGYTSVPNVSVSGGGSTGSITETATNLSITSIAVNNGGSGYSNTPTVSISGGGGSGGAAAASVSGGVVTGITVSNAGSGYTSVPTVTIASSAGSGSVVSVNLGSAGSGYTSAPTVTFSGGGGSGAAATATFDAPSGTVTGFTVTSQGSGYTSAPTVTLTGGGGTGATATATLGTPSSGAQNIGATLVAALGRCEDLYSTSAGVSTYHGGYIYTNELSTVAAAYALGQFATVTGSGSSEVISIGAPITNNSRYAVSGYSTGCVTTAISGCATPNSSSTTYQPFAAGLLHAFENASNLVNIFLPPSNGSSSANTALPNSANTTAVLPTAMVNTLANAAVSCVNSTGTASPACTTFLAGGGASGTPAGDVFSALKYMAAHPALMGAGATVSQIANLGTGATNVYAPFLTSTPHDLSMPIVYTTSGNSVEATSTTGGLGVANVIQSIALDANDDVYIGNATALCSGIGGVTCTSTASNIVELASNGAILGASSAVSSSTDAFQANPAAMSVDGANNLYAIAGGQSSHPLVKWATPISSSSTGSDIACTACGTNIVYALGADRFSNVFFGLGAGFLAEDPASTGTPVILNGTAFGSLPVTSTFVDPYSNVWAGTYRGTFNEIEPNTGGISFTTPPAYGGTPVAGSPVGANTGTFFGSGSPYLVVQDKYSGTIQTSNGPSKTTITLSSFAVTAAATTAGANSTYDNQTPGGALDGSNTVWNGTVYTNSNGSGLVYTPQNAGVYTSNTGSFVQPCYALTTANTTCTYPFNYTVADYTTAAPVTAVAHVLIDSTGSLWTDNGTGGAIIQLIGIATPSYPLLGAKLGNKP